MHRLDVWMTNNGTLCGVRVTLTNGAQSPIFKSQSTDFHTSISIRQDLAPSKIAMVVGPYTCKAIRISDHLNLDLAKWVGIEDTPYKEQTVPLGEEIVGVYGGHD